MSAIVTKYVADHKLSKDMSNEELSQHAPALLELLTDKLKRDKGRQRFQKGYNFSREQAFVLVPDQRICRSRSRVTPKEGGMKQRIVRDNLSEKEVKAIAKALTDAISSGQLRDPGVPGVKWFNTFLKKDRFLPETGKPLLPSYLRKLEAVFAVVSNSVKNLSEAMTIASQALRHSPDNHASPAQNYTIVNYRKKG
ncbi:hypothetical protein RhiirC2_801502 [Rhizophagus irregularis]|uniref:Uncharacterized protein n=1 Tax=Rhizophagus irregularis TaxID=588596 RepID=A0A2N1M2A1_9GLOM|nr:hypothetical protein RhiirC2_801502 [Rhizophagus irregularis]